ncbi:MAG: formate--tetrahydrofolate ligase, partial [Gammaproteobacteria bacterium]|nr:formate--tetrahydrofolate ligase [Gammaproteobacteria bacterium]
LKLADYVVTEAGFGADLGAEKFVDIKCRKAGLTPSMVVLVATIRALKYHGGAALKTIHTEDLAALAKGLPNLERHINNIRNHYGLPCVVAVNRFPTDSAAEIQALGNALAHHGVQVIPADHWARGGAGAEQLAQTVADEIERVPPQVRFVYHDDDPLWYKIEKVAMKIYDATEVVADTRVREKIKGYQESGYGHYPVCIAKTQYSFSSDPKLRGAPSGHVLPIRDVYLAAGAEFLVAVCGDIMTMPGLPRTPAANHIDLDDENRVVGLF